MLRVITVAVISVDRCFHILRPLKYLLIATKWRVKAACEIIVILPLLRIAPMIQVLRMYKEASIYCRQYQDSDSDFLHGTPLDCFLVTPSEISTYKTADEVITGAMVGAFWGIMLASNITILVVVFQFDRTFTGNLTRRQVRMFGAKLKLMKSGLAVLVISSFFALTNFPLAYSWAAHIFHKEWNYTQHYYLVFPLPLLPSLALLFEDEEY